MTDARKPRKCQIIMLDERRLDLLVQVSYYFTRLAFYENYKMRQIDRSEANINRVNFSPPLNSAPADVL